MNPIHRLELRFDAVPIGFYILCVNASDWIHELQGMTYHVVPLLSAAAHPCMLPMSHCRLWSHSSDDTAKLAVEFVKTCRAQSPSLQELETGWYRPSQKPISYVLQGGLCDTI